MVNFTGNLTVVSHNWLSKNGDTK